MMCGYNICIGSLSNAPTKNCPLTISSAISHYCTYLKYVYSNSPMSPDSKWPPSPSREFISLAVVEGQSCRDEYIGHTLQGNIKQVLSNKKEISIEQILEPVQDKLKLALIEGAPGIGKSTLAWELCRKWEEISCMQQYSLVVLLRLREEEVQNITEVSHLFITYESKHKKSLVEEVSESQGNGVLFILDGFDELPKTLQKKGFLLKLVKGHVLPASTVLVTSRPSATAELLISCHTQKHIEVLGFTQDSVKLYASSIFSSEPGKLRRFMNYISASENPAINSLMYVPLNAAIIVRIYLNCKSDALLPHTLTQMYTSLCLTILNRHLENSVENFDDLPAELYKNFLCLSRIAFEGILNQEVIFHTFPPGLVHFGFLDAVSALYGGGKVSYNFLHLTLQEFFAAYHISYLCTSGLEVFKQHGKDQRWNVVWRFVAGLTKFKHYEGHMDSDLFIMSGDTLFGREDVSTFAIRCLFEAQSVDHFSLIFRALQLLPAQTATVRMASTLTNHSWACCTPLDAYALGFCISNFHTGVFWNVQVDDHFQHFACGLNRKTPSVGIITQLGMNNCVADFSELKEHHLHHVTNLSLRNCETNVSKFIPHMTCLKELTITGPAIAEDLYWLLRQLPRSNVTTLDITNTGFCRSLIDSPLDYYSALEQLIRPSSGKLEKLRIGDDNRDTLDVGRLASLVSAPSSLKSLDLCLNQPKECLKSNACITTLQIPVGKVWSKLVIQLLEHNKTLQHLVLRFYPDFNGVCAIISAIIGNITLQSITLVLFKHDLDQKCRALVQLDHRITIAKYM